MKRDSFLMIVGVMISLFISNDALAVSTAIPGATRAISLTTLSFFSPGSSWTDQVVAAGDGNITGSKNVPLGWDITVNGSKNNYSTDVFRVTTNGLFRLKTDAWANYDRIAIGLKIGSNKSPDWAIFELAQFAKSGVWSSAPLQGGELDHYMVYTIGGNGNGSAAVPLPGAFWFFGASLLSLLGAGRAIHPAKFTMVS